MALWTMAQSAWRQRTRTKDSKSWHKPWKFEKKFKKEIVNITE
jgi:hypothetical protein